MRRRLDAAPVESAMPGGAAVGDSECERALQVHAAHYARLLDREGPRLRGAGLPDAGRGQREVFLLLQAERGNVSAALNTALALDGTQWLLPLARYLWRYLDIASEFLRMRQHYRRLAREARRLDNAPLALWSQLGLARACLRLGQYEQATRSSRNARRRALQLHDPAAEARATVTLGVIERDQGRYAEAQALFERALPSLLLHDPVDADESAETLRERFRRYTAIITRDLGIGRYWRAHCLEALGIDDYDVADDTEAATFGPAADLEAWYVEVESLNHIGNLTYVQKDYPRARAMFERSLLLSRRVGDRSSEGQSLNNLGLVASALGDFEQSRAMHALSLVLCRELGHRLGEGVNLHNLGGVEYALGNMGVARELFALALARHRDLGDSAGTVDAIGCAGAVLAADGDWGHAALALWGSEKYCAALAHCFDPEDARIIELGRQALDAAIGRGEFRRGAVVSCRMRVEEIPLAELAEGVLRALQD
jgi:tetratricopeptide (TPR) repeat protein